jgi:hypothetical protein
MNPMLLVALDCQFVIAPSVSSYVYLYFYDIMIALSVSSYVYLYFYDIMIAPSVSSYVYLYFCDIMMMFALYKTNTLSA